MRNKILLTAAALAFVTLPAAPGHADANDAGGGFLHSLISDWGATTTGSVSQSFAPLAPDESIFSSAATPIGWAEESERRLAEEQFARGESEELVPPNAIGGGPSDFND